MFSIFMMGVFTFIYLVAMMQGNMFVMIISAMMGIGWTARYFVPLPCQCRTPCPKGRCER